MNKGADPPQVSVIIPAFNAAKTIERALVSAHEQAGVSFEIIVIDDRSTDDTIAIVQRLDWPEIRLVALPVNGGVSAARNAGIRTARGEFIAFLDSDDEWFPQKLSKQLNLFQIHSSASIVATDCEIGFIGGKRLRHHHEVTTAQGADAWKQLLQASFLHTSTIVCRREMVLELGGFPEDLTFGEDLDLWIRLALRGEVRIVPEVLVRVHNQPAGLSATQPRGDLIHTLPMIRGHVEALGDRLTASERKAILGRRHFDIAHPLYLSGAFREAAPLFQAAFRFGWRRGKSMAFFLDCRLGGMLRRLTRCRAEAFTMKEAAPRIK